LKSNIIAIYHSWNINGTQINASQNSSIVCLFQQAEQMLAGINYTDVLCCTLFNTYPFRFINILIN